MWNAISLVQDLNLFCMSISYDNNHYTTGESYGIKQQIFIIILSR